MREYDDDQNGFGDLSDRQLLVRIYERVREIRRDLKDHETRIRGLERVRFMVLGGALAVGAIFGVIFNALAQIPWGFLAHNR